MISSVNLSPKLLISCFFFRINSNKLLKLQFSENHSYLSIDYCMSLMKRNIFFTFTHKMISYITNNFGLREKDMQYMMQLFRSYPAVEKVILYGSRARGDFRLGFDVVHYDTMENQVLKKLINKEGVFIYQKQEEI